MVVGGCSEVVTVGTLRDISIEDDIFEALGVFLDEYGLVDIWQEGKLDEKVNGKVEYKKDWMDNDENEAKGQLYSWNVTWREIYIWLGWSWDK